MGYFNHYSINKKRYTNTGPSQQFVGHNYFSGAYKKKKCDDFRTKAMTFS